jgi:hypothetical protein
MNTITKKWADRRLRKNIKRRRERDARVLAEQALRCLRLSDPKPFAPRTMRDWFA